MKVKFFGEIAEAVGETEADIVLKNASTLELIAYLESTFDFDRINFHLAVNHQIVDKKENLPIKESDQIAVLSPFAGG